ncbi:MAG TPA: hypothetical protein VD835_00645, partial [Pyrinomonadaceae bacterium]|nr:hypothetical protein [Pyrinomonadaceae bacterium]
RSPIFRSRAGGFEESCEKNYAEAGVGSWNRICKFNFSLNLKFDSPHRPSAQQFENRGADGQSRLP